MRKLSIQTFLSSSDDYEANQYLILGSLKSYYAEFSHNRLYPFLSELIELAGVLEEFLREKSNFERHLPQHIKEIDTENKRIIFEPYSLENADLERVYDLIEWALPHIKTAVGEAMGIYDFVEENISVEEVGLVPAYRKEGYYFVPEHKVSVLHILRYEVSLFTSEHERFRALKMRMLQSIEQTLIHHSPESIKLDLLEQYHDLANPATYICETDLDLPFEETILPVAKRMLMRMVGV